MELNEEEKELIKFSIGMSIESFNKIPSKFFKRKNMNKVVTVKKYENLLKRFN